MSRIFTSTPETYISSQSSPSISAFTFAAWVFFTGAFGTLFVKDPVGTYATWMEVNADGTLIGAAGGNDTSYGVLANRSVGSGGSGYATNDTGSVNFDPDILANKAQYIVNAQTGGVVTNAGITDGGSPVYQVGHTYTTTKGGSQAGSGSGLTITVNTITQPGSSAAAGSNESLTLNAWNHVALTWDSAGDKLVHLYINGVECTYKASTGRQPSGAADTSTGPYVIGGDTFASSLDGDMAEVILDTVARTSVEIAALAASSTGATFTPTDYFHLCGTDDPEPNATNPTNFGTLSASAPAQGPVSPGYSCVTVGPTTDGTVGVGQYGGNSLAEAFYNPHHLDILQVVNEGGEVIWNLDYAGEAEDNPDDATPQALLGKFIGQTFAAAFPNPYNENILQIVGQGDNIVFWVDYQGNAGTA